VWYLLRKLLLVCLVVEKHLVRWATLVSPCRSTALLQPHAPCVTTEMWMRLLACERLPGQPKVVWHGSVIPGHGDEPATSGHEPTWIRPIRPPREQLLHLRQRLVLFEPLMPSLCLVTQSAIYTCQYGLGRHALIVDFYLINCGFDGWILLLQICLNKLLLIDEVIWTVEIHFHIPGATIFAL
jgi:hypothetical protein